MEHDYGGQLAAEIRVEFGDGASDTMPLEWAHVGMRWLKANEPHVFMAMLAHVFSIQMPEARTRRTRANGS